MAEIVYPRVKDYRSQALDDDLSIILWVADGLLGTPEVRGKDTIIPGLRGRVARNRLADRRSIILEGWLLGDTPSDFADIRATILSVFDPELFPGTLTVTLEDGSTATISARTIDVMPGDGIIADARAVSIELEAVDVDWTFTGS